MKKISFFNSLALNFGGTYVRVLKYEVIHEHYKVRFKKFKLICVHTHTERFLKDGKVIVTEFYDEKDESGNLMKTIRKYNYLDYNYDLIEFKKFETIK